MFTHVNSPVTPQAPGYRQAIAAEVRAQMARAGLNQQRLLALMTDRGQGMAPTTLSDRLAGRRAFNTDQLAAIAQALGVDTLLFLSVPSSTPTEASA